MHNHLVVKKIRVHETAHEVSILRTVSAKLWETPTP